MSKKSFMAAIIILLFLISAVAVLFVDVAEANPLPPSWMNPKMTITIQSPLYGTHNALPVFVNFTAQSSDHFSLSTNESQEWFCAFFYALDGQSMRFSGTRFTEIQMTGSQTTGTDHYFSGQAYLTNLTDGIHSITIYWGVIVNNPSPNSDIVYDASWSGTSQFYVKAETPSQTPTLAPTATTTPTPTPPFSWYPVSEVSPTPNNTPEKSTTIAAIACLLVAIIIVGLVIGTVIIGLMAYSAKNKGLK